MVIDNRTNGIISPPPLSLLQNGWTPLIHNDIVCQHFLDTGQYLRPKSLTCPNNLLLDEDYDTVFMLYCKVSSRRITFQSRFAVSHKWYLKYRATFQIWFVLHFLSNHIWEVALHFSWFSSSSFSICRHCKLYPLSRTQADALSDPSVCVRPLPRLRSVYGFWPTWHACIASTDVSS